MKNIVSALIVLFCNVCVIQASSLFKIDDNYLSQHDIVYLEPEFDSFNGFPLGNGDLGGMLWFTNEGITLQINKIDLYDKPANGRMTLRSAGRLNVNLGVPCYSYMHLADFEARLSLQNADLKIKSSTPFADTEITSWVDANSNVWVIDCQADYKKTLPSGAVNRISLERWGSCDFGGWYGSRDRDVANGLGTAKVNRQENDIILEEKFEGGLHFTIACRVLETPTEILRVSDRESSMITPLSSKQKYKILISVVSSNDSDNPTQKSFIWQTIIWRIFIIFVVILWEVLHGENIRYHLMAGYGLLIMIIVSGLHPITGIPKNLIGGLLFRMIVIYYDLILKLMSI